MDFSSQSPQYSSSTVDILGSRIWVLILFVIFSIILYNYQNEIIDWKERQKLYLKEHLRKRFFQIEDGDSVCIMQSGIKGALWDFLDKFLLAPSYDDSLAENFENAENYNSEEEHDENEDEEEDDEEEDDEEEDDEVEDDEEDDDEEDDEEEDDEEDDDEESENDNNDGPNEE
tara:strand:- start:106 stop:624 length:519 start_codon:yes stop_codon:yes gene_type:complete